MYNSSLQNTIIMRELIKQLFLKYTHIMQKEPFSRLDGSNPLRKKLLSYCRLKPGEIWIDPYGGHKVGLLDCCDTENILGLFEDGKAVLSLHDPPYNIAVGNRNTVQLSHTHLSDYLAFSEKWIRNSNLVMADNSHLYIWLGADQTRHFEPFADFIIMMRSLDLFRSRSFITLRNQRGYGTQKNWMCVRQELLYYTKGNPHFTVVYTDIPKILKGYYKQINGKLTENTERSKSGTIRPGNVWVDIQQVFYRMEENVPGAYAQKPLKAIIRIILSSSKENDLVCDFFSHSGTSLIAAELTKRRCFTCDIDPVFTELSIRRLEHFRQTGKTGFQTKNPFPEIDL